MRLMRTRARTYGSTPRHYASGSTSRGSSSTCRTRCAAFGWKRKAMALSKSEMISHPDLNALAAFIDRRLSEADHAEMVTHLVGCEECRALVAAHARGQMPVAEGSESAGPRSRSPFRPAVWLPIAATLALATTALMLSRSDRASVTPSPSA